MRIITKAAEPQKLANHREQEHNDYDNYQHKDALRTSLVKEQKGLCCYCMSRITAEAPKMKIEHWRCRASYPDLQLTYGNLLGACQGGEGQPTAKQHCDTKKANGKLNWNPADSAHAVESRLQYLADGTVESMDAKFDDQLNTLLGLNLAHLKSQRKAVLDSTLTWWRTTLRARQKIQQQIDKRTDPFSELVPFSPVAVWFLKQKQMKVTR